MSKKHNLLLFDLESRCIVFYGMTLSSSIVRREKASIHLFILCVIFFLYISVAALSVVFHSLLKSLIAWKGRMSAVIPFSFGFSNN